MFIGHVAVGLAAKRLAPEASLGVLVAAPLFVDLLWPLFLAGGLEWARVDPGNTAVTPLAFEHYPWTHSLAAGIVWAVIAALAYLAAAHYAAGTLAVGVGVVSHWVLDWVTHRPDMPLWPNGPLGGLGLWNSVAGTLAVEGALFAAGVWLYLRATRPRDRAGVWGFWSFVVVLVLIYLANVFGPPPPDMRTVMLAGLALWLVPLWAWWLDRHREPA